MAKYMFYVKSSGGHIFTHAANCKDDDAAMAYGENLMKADVIKVHDINVWRDAVPELEKVGTCRRI